MPPLFIAALRCRCADAAYACAMLIFIVAAMLIITPTFSYAVTLVTPLMHMLFICRYIICLIIDAATSRRYH